MENLNLNERLFLKNLLGSKKKEAVAALENKPVDQGIVASTYTTAMDKLSNTDNPKLVRDEVLACARCLFSLMDELELDKEKNKTRLAPLYDIEKKLEAMEKLV